MLKSYGYIRYDPKSHHTSFKEWWLILDCDPGLVEYYRYWINNFWPVEIPSSTWLNAADLNPINDNWIITQTGLSTTLSVWGPHISVIRGEKPLYPELWKKYQGERIEFYYNPENLSTNGKHWYISHIDAPDLKSIRAELGLSPERYYIERKTGLRKLNDLHLTICSATPRT